MYINIHIIVGMYVSRYGSASDHRMFDVRYKSCFVSVRVLVTVDSAFLTFRRQLCWFSVNNTLSLTATKQLSVILHPVVRCLAMYASTHIPTIICTGLFKNISALQSDRWGGVIIIQLQYLSSIVLKCMSWEKIHQLYLSNTNNSEAESTPVIAEGIEEIQLKLQP